MRDDETRSRKLAKQLRRTLTKAEVILWVNLRSLSALGYNFRRQHPVGPYVADFAHIKGKLIIEVDGATHWTPEERAHDVRRTAFLNSKGWTVFRCLNDDIYRDVSLVVEEIMRRLPPSVIDGPTGRDATSPARGGG